MKHIFLISFILLASCFGGGQSKAVQQETAAVPKAELIALVSTAGQTTVAQGGEIAISFELAGEGADSVILYIAGNRIGDIGEGPCVYKLADNHRTGQTIYRVEAFRKGGSSSKSGGFTVLSASAPATYGYRVLNTYPHDPKAYTQGLYWHEGYLYEGTGLNGASSLRKVELATGKVLQRRDLGKEFFGEGIALLNGKIYQLTWQSKRGFIYDAETFEHTGEFGYNSEGWGITTDGEVLYMSDGTEKIFVMGPDLKRIKTLEVYDTENKIMYINELEWVEGEIWANVYMTPYIIRIDPETGALKGIIDFTGLVQRTDITADTDVLNGIAYDAKTKRVFVTGKNWNKLFHIEAAKTTANNKAIE